MKYSLLTLLLVFTIPVFAQAEIFDLQINFGSNRINAVEGVVVLPPSLVVENIYLGDSALLLWITKPIFNQADHTITFSGITPGGISGQENILTLETQGTPLVEGGSVVGYLHDGNGTVLQLEADFVEGSLSEDLESPEPFLVSISSSPDLFNGQRFISFLAQDKNTGIDYYEYASTWLLAPDSSDWKRVESPVPLNFVDSFKILHVRAFDKVGNAKDASATGPYRYATMLFGLIIILCLIAYTKRSLFSWS
jgi:hypothetical protein